MHLPKYPYKTSEKFLDYLFVSEGPKGKIKKVVRYLQIDEGVYNLGFGDLDGETGKVNDRVTTDNKDGLKVLATVANTIIDFSNQYPDASVLIKGSTPSRTRMYRIGITKVWHEISAYFEIWGFVRGEWKPFTSQGEYEAFLVRRKWL